MNLFDLLPGEWANFLDLGPDYFGQIESNISRFKIIPDKSKIFAAFNLPPDRVKVVLIGQDPYPNPQDAMGLAFSVSKDSQKIPASLKNIKKELETDLSLVLSSSGDLSAWVNQGVLLLNRILTTTENQSNAHRGLGWEEFTEKVVSRLAKRDVVFLLWGNQAIELEKFIDPKNLVKGVHPSPLSAYKGFFGSKPFSAVNQRLNELGLDPVRWNI